MGVFGLRNAAVVGSAWLALALGLAALAPAAQQPGGPVDPAKLPDIIGVHLGMTIPQTLEALKKSLPVPAFELGMSFGPGDRQKATYLIRTNNTDAGGQGGIIEVDTTLPPNPQVVWKMSRTVRQPNVNRDVFMAALRQKYGKESVGIDDDTRRAGTNDATIIEMFWVMDEQGHLVSGIPPVSNNTPFRCPSEFGNTIIKQPPQPLPMPEYCAKSYVAMHVSFGRGQIITITQMDMVDIPLVLRNGNATYAFTQGQNQKIMQEDQQKSKGVSPNL
jgi:hypothetical protein